MSQFPSGPFDSKDPFGQQPPPSPYQSPQGGYGYQQPPQSTPVSPLALISLISGIGSIFVSFFGCCCGFFFAATFVAGLTAVITGHVALAKFQREPGRESGKEMAIIGLVLGYMGLALVLVIVILMIVAMFAPALVPLFAPDQKPFQFPPIEVPEPN
jgi:hypothetical protein